jgi:hypothetical protein
VQGCGSIGTNGSDSDPDSWPNDPHQSKEIQSPYWSNKKKNFSAAWNKTLYLVTIVIGSGSGFSKAPNPDPNSLNAAAGYAV